MKKATALLFLALVGVSLGCLFEKGTDGRRNTRATHWSYEGESGPSHWGDLDATYATCKSGHHQTPINIAESPSSVHGYPFADLEWTSGEVENAQVDNNGHTVVIDGSSANTLTGGPLFSDQYQLLQFHMHGPSEHTVNGKQFPLEVHFVHRHIDGEDLAVVGVLFDVGLSDNEWLENVLDNLPEDEEAPVKHINIVPYDGLPYHKGYYHYSGSLTTPPCSEGVNWFVMKEVQSLSQRQLNEWLDVVPVSSRPTQPVLGRTVFSSADSDNHEGHDHPEGNGNGNTVININFGGMFDNDKE
eukprot:TRINITY_DN8320_c0_g1_i1.p2 TRINITY_DN8320_c0_g1~~TRINITY_DN8320_c0_g1_i1.p2  ORF type:complete len:300 (+),score=81.49 TRINITY_DN8320_c0_g1_i1:1104-2003(+)